LHALSRSRDWGARDCAGVRLPESSAPDFTSERASLARMKIEIRAMLQSGAQIQVRPRAFAPGKLCTLGALVSWSAYARFGACAQ